MDGAWRRGAHAVGCACGQAADKHDLVDPENYSQRAREMFEGGPGGELLM